MSEAPALPHEMVDAGPTRSGDEQPQEEQRIERPTSAVFGVTFVAEEQLRPWQRHEPEPTDFERTALVHLDALYRTALRLTRNRAEAEDVVQETCLRAFRAFDRFDPGSNCRAWLFTILRNVFLNRQRGRDREVGAADDVLAAETGYATMLGSPASNPEEEFFQTVLHGDVDRALNALPLVYREAVMLADLEGLSYREMCDVLGCPVGTVMSRLARGRRLLQRSLAGFAREHGYLREER
jgi:RNA polymerase sigma-70 factor (ECF subfamily)